MAARGPVSNVFVKVGSRPHGFHDTRVLGGEARIEDGRDYKAIDLMSIFRNNEKIYSDLIKDIANRRMTKTAWFQQRGISDLKAILKELEPLEEAELYRRGKTDPDSHLKILKYFCQPFDEEIINCEDLAKRIKQLTTETLYQKYLVLEACRRLQRLKDKKPKKPEVIKRGYNELIKSLKEIAHFVKVKGSVKLNSKIYYKLKDMREPSLFLLASEFNQQKYYCGFETLKLMSEGIPLSFIKLCRAMFDEIGYRVNEFEKSKAVDCSWQNRVVRKVASDIRRQTMSDLCSGQSFMTLVDELGFIYRKMQLAPTAPYPTPNGFSIEKEIAWPSESQANICEVVSKENNIELLKRILKEATDWGYLIELPHR